MDLTESQLVYWVGLRTDAPAPGAVMSGRYVGKASALSAARSSSS